MESASRGFNLIHLDNKYSILCIVFLVLLIWDPLGVVKPVWKINEISGFSLVLLLTVGLNHPSVSYPSSSHVPLGKCFCGSCHPSVAVILCCLMPLYIP